MNRRQLLRLSSGALLALPLAGQQRNTIDENLLTPPQLSDDCIFALTGWIVPRKTLDIRHCLNLTARQHDSVWQMLKIGMPDETSISAGEEEKLLEQMVTIHQFMTRQEQRGQ